MPEFSTDRALGRSFTLRELLGVHGRSFRRAIAVLEPRRLPFEWMHTHSFGLLHANEALRTLAAGIGSMHVSIRP